MKKKTAKILILSAVALLAVVILVIFLVRRRGRKVDDGTPLSGKPSISDNIAALTGKKVYVKNRDTVNVLWYDDFSRYYYFDKTLEYVVVPLSPSEETDEEGKVFIEVCAVGHNIGGRLVRTVLSKPAYIAKSYLNI